MVGPCSARVRVVWFPFATESDRIRLPKESDIGVVNISNVCGWGAVALWFGVDVPVGFGSPFVVAWSLGSDFSTCTM